MTSTSVSNLSMPGSVGLQNLSGAKNNANGSFMEVMQTTNKSRQTADVSAGSKSADRSMKMENKSREVPVAEEKQTDASKLAGAKEQVDAVAEDVKKAIADELDVTEEEIEQAMEELGFGILDLFHPANLSTLVTKLSDVENGAQLLLSDSFAQISGDVKELLASLEESAGLSLVELEQMFGNVQDWVNEADVMPEDIASAENAQAEVGKAQNGHETNENDRIFQQSGESESLGDEIHESAEREVSWQKTIVSDSSTADQRDFGQNDGRDHENMENHVYQNQELQGRTDTFMTNLQNGSVGTSEPVVELPTGERVFVSSIIDQIVEVGRTSVQAGTTTVELLLNPEGLGKVLMEVSQENGQVKAHIYTENEQVKEALENQMFQLKEQMNQSQTKVTSIEVSVGTHEFERNLEEGQQQEEQQQQQDTKERRMRNLSMDQLSELQGLMTQEEELAAKIMRDQGNSLNVTA